MLRYLLRLLVAVFLVETVLAKDGSYMVGATIDRGNSQPPVETTISLPEGYDEMVELRRLPSPAVVEVPYGIVLHYDFEESGGQRDWHGWYDGADLLYFPSDMIVGPGIWAAGWYEANPLLAQTLSSALTHHISPPSTGDGGLVR